MTDLRPRNDDLLYGTDSASAQGRALTAVFGSIVAAAGLLVGSYLTGSYNPASTGFSTAVRAAQPPATEPATPTVTGLPAPASRNRS